MDTNEDLQADEEEELPTWSRTFAGYRQRFVEPFTLKLREHRPLVLEQAPCVSAAHARESKASADGSCTASTVWDAGIVLGDYVSNTYRSKTPCSRRLLDLGAGTGIVGLAAAACGGFGHVVLTDLPTVTPLLERNVAQNAAASGKTTVEVLPVAWDDAHQLRQAAARGPYHLIVGGDLLYRPQVVPPLLHALRCLVGSETVVLLSASLLHSPETIRLFAHEAERAGFLVEQLGAAGRREDAWFSAEVRMLRLTSRADPPTEGTAPPSQGEEVEDGQVAPASDGRLEPSEAGQGGAASSSTRSRKARKRKRNAAAAHTGGGSEPSCDKLGHPK